MSKNEEKTYSVSELNRLVKGMLESRFSTVWLEGEISNFSQPASGHMYFTLKDKQAQIKCAMFKGRNVRLRFRPESGLAVKARGNVSLYEARGDYQFIIDTLQPAGSGALQQEFEALKVKLREEGLFEASHKKEIPHYPLKLGLITSPTGAAIRDVLSVLERRYRLLDIEVYPTAVQGTEAAAQIVKALRAADRSDCDVLLLTRGGGSLEDLWSFNEEVVARAVFACKTPVVSAVGHETDFCIAEFVADIRAATPSAAAEIISPDCEEIASLLEQYNLAFTEQMTRFINQRQQTLDWCDKRLAQQHPDVKMKLQCEKLEALKKQLRSNIQATLHTFDERFERIYRKLIQLNPARKLDANSARLKELSLRLYQSQKTILDTAKSKLELLNKGLEAISPQATLDRGYSIVTNKDGLLIDTVTELREFDLINVKFSQGELEATVDKIKPDN